LQARQAPLQATLQQRPSVQKPEAHSLAAVHTAPRGFLPQLPSTHGWPSTQSVSARHDEKHWFFEGSQSYGAQTMAAPGLQRPVPSHT
jgi:hypothetical protein